jgi:DNA-binding IclR family transcriptional regulator
MDNKASKVPALHRAIAILDHIAAHGACQGSALIPVINAPKSSVYLLLEELRELRLVSLGTDGLYRLGIRMIEFGDKAAGQLDLRDLARPCLQQLMQDTGLLCHLGILEDAAAYYILKIESQGTIRVRSWEGKPVSLYSSGLGKCLLAWADNALQDKLIAQLEFKQWTPNTITDPDRLHQELVQIRSRGWSYDNEEEILNVRCIACPVFDSRKRAAAAISVVGTSLQVHPDSLPGIRDKVIAAAQALSQELGHHPD